MYNDDIDRFYSNNITNNSYNLNDNNDNSNNDNVYEKLTGLWVGTYVGVDNSIHSNKQLRDIFLSFSEDGVLEGLGFDENNLPFTINGNVLPQGEVSFNLRSTDRCVAFSGQCDMIKQIHGSTFTADMVIKKISNINCENICKLLQKINPYNFQITGQNNITKCMNNINLSFNVGKWEKEEYNEIMSEIYNQQSSDRKNKNLIHIISDSYDQKSKEAIIIGDLDLKTFNVLLVTKKLHKIETYFGSLKPSKVEIECKGPGVCQIQFSPNGKFQQSLRRTPNLISLCIKNNRSIHNADNGIMTDEKVDSSYSNRSNNKVDDRESFIVQDTIVDDIEDDENDMNNKSHKPQINNNMEIKKPVRSSLVIDNNDSKVLMYDSFDQKSDNTYVKLLDKSVDSDEETTPDNSNDTLKILNGVWCGCSCSDPSSLSTYTIWRDMNLVTSSDFNSQKIDGNGISEWRGHNIPYTVDVEINNKTDDTVEDSSSLSSSFIMTKTHKGKFKNAIKYKCHLIYIHHMYAMQFLSTFESLEKSPEIFEIKLCCDDGTKSDYATCIVGHIYGTSNTSNGNGTVRLIKVSEDNVDLSWYSWLAVFRDGQQINKESNEQIMNSQSMENKDDNITISVNVSNINYSESKQGNSSMISNDHCVDDSDFQKATGDINNNNNNNNSGNNDNSNSNSSSNSSILRYRLLVSELLMNYSNGMAIHTSDIKLLEEFRSVHDVSGQEHEQILASLGWTNEKLLEILSSNKVNANTNDIKQHYCVTCKSKAITNDENTDGNKCRICYELQIDCILLPCAHFAVCMVCALKMDTCPFDRTKIIRIQQIYRVT